ncbi:aldehyde dehydrogenase family protein [Natrialbaceae archaeon A-CW1-1]
MRYETFETLSGDERSIPIVDRMYIGGEFVTGSTVFENYSPSTETKLADVPIASERQIQRAVNEAQNASQKWRKMSVWERRERVETVADAIEEKTDELTQLEVADNGSCISKLTDDVHSGVKTLRYFAGIATELKGDSIPASPDTVDYTKREPYGVVAGIIPFNHPAAFVARKLGPAVIAGNGLVIKPSEYTPLSALYIAHIIDNTTAFPDGLVNIVTGGADVGKSLVRHPGVGMISAIGSSETGKSIMRGAAENLSNVLLELGGKNPVIVFPDADLETAADGVIDSMNLTWQGQSCGSGSRLLVHENLYQPMIESITERISSLEIGDPFDRDNDIGSIVSEPQYEKVRAYIENAKEEGANVLTGGSPVETFDTGYFFKPTLLEVTPEMTIANEETFGPVLSVIQWSDYDEMIDIANNVDYGLTASIWTENLDTAHRTTEKLEAGVVWVNHHGNHYLGAPFGGYKQSGVGKTESIEELLEHTRIKNINIKLRE